MKFKKNNLKRGIISNLSSVGYMPRWIVLAVDLVLCTLAFIWPISWCLNSTITFLNTKK